jgi:peptidoglycan/LPS O-acetylase OafA/YrhL
MYSLVLLLGWVRLITPTILLSAMLGLALLQFTLIDYFDLSHVVLFQLFLLAPSVKLGLFFLSGSLLYVLRERFSVRADVACVMVLALVGTFRTSIGPLIFQITLPYLIIWAAQANLKWLKRFGRYGDFSYGIYLFAFPVQQLLVHTIGALHVGIFALMAFLVTFPLAAVSWYWVEKPALAWKTKTLRPWGPRQPVGV